MIRAGVTKVMKGLMLASVFWAMCAFLACAAGASEYVEPNMDSDTEECAQEAAETEGDEEEAEPEPRRMRPVPDAPYVKYELDRQLQDTGLMFSPYDPGEARPSNGRYRTFPQQGAPFFFVEDEEEGNDEDEGETEDEGKEEDCPTPD